MAWKRRFGGSMVTVVGYLLSPLSWWNDMFVNVPLALLFAWGVSAFHQAAFTPALVIGYWLTNVAGLVLLHKGVRQLLSAQGKDQAGTGLRKDVAVSLAYTFLIVALVKFGVLQPFDHYFR